MKKTFLFFCFFITLSFLFTSCENELFLFVLNQKYGTISINEKVRSRSYTIDDSHGPWWPENETGFNWISDADLYIITGYNTSVTNGIDERYFLTSLKAGDQNGMTEKELSGAVITDKIILSSKSISLEGTPEFGTIPYKLSLGDWIFKVIILDTNDKEIEITDYSTTQAEDCIIAEAFSNNSSVANDSALTTIYAKENNISFSLKNEDLRDGTFDFTLQIADKLIANNVNYKFIVSLQDYHNNKQIIDLDSQSESTSITKEIEDTSLIDEDSEYIINENAFTPIKIESKSYLLKVEVFEKIDTSYTQLGYFQSKIAILPNELTLVNVNILNLVSGGIDINIDDSLISYPTF